MRKTGKRPEVCGFSCGLPLEEDQLTPSKLKQYVAMHLESLIQNEGRGRGRIHVGVPTARGDVRIKLPEAYQVSSRLRGAVKALPGIDYVKDL